MDIKGFEEIKKELLELIKDFFDNNYIRKAKKSKKD